MLCIWRFNLFDNVSTLDIKDSITNNRSTNYDTNVYLFKQDPECLSI